MFLRWVLKCSFRYDACKNRSYGENKGKQGRKAKTEQFVPPHFGNCWAHLDHFLKLKLCVQYLVSKLGKSGVHRFKRCLIWSWNEAVMAVWRWLCTPWTKILHFANVGHIFEVLTGAQIMHTISLFESWEVRSPELQTVLDLELKWKSYGHLKTTVQSWTKMLQPHPI